MAPNGAGGIWPRLPICNKETGTRCRTARGFYLLSRAYTVLSCIGAAIELHRPGYRKVPLGKDGRGGSSLQR